MANPVKQDKSLYLFKKLLISKCLKDANFKERFLKNPKEAIEQEFKLKLPNEIQIKAIEDTQTSFTVVLPSSKEVESSHEYELSSEELQSISGGVIQGETIPQFNERFKKWYEGDQKPEDHPGRTSSM